MTNVEHLYLYSLVICAVECVDAQSCLTLWDFMDCNPSGPSVPEVFQAWLLEWGAISTSRESSTKWSTQEPTSPVSPALSGEFFYLWATSYFLSLDNANLYSISIDLWSFMSWLPLVCCFCSVAQSCSTLCDPMDCSTPGFRILQYLPEFAETHVHWVDDAMQLSHLLSPSSPPAFNLSIRVFSSESALSIRWPKFWSFCFIISPANGYCQWIIRVDFL